jgi:uncharacterized repeat protein (TIGR01451 family)
MLRGVKLPLRGGRLLVVIGAIAAGLSARGAGAVADGTPLTRLVSESVFGAAVAVGNTLMEHDGQVNFAVRAGGSEATIPLSRMAPDATVARAFLFWGGTFQPGQGIPLDRTVDFRLPDGTFFNDLSVDQPVAGEAPSALSRCVQRNHNIGGANQPMFVCRREITTLLQRLGPGGAVGTYGVDDVNLKSGDCVREPNLCQAAFGGWAVAVMWESPSEPVRRDLVLFDGFFALDEQGSVFGGFSSGIGPVFQLDGFTIGDTADGELTFMGFEGDAQLGVPPQNLGGLNACNDGRCEDFIQIRTNSNATFTKLRDATNRPGNLLNGSNNLGGGLHPGIDIDTFDIGPSGLNVLRPNDTVLFLQAGSGDGVPDDGSGGSGELFLLGFTLLSVETFSPRFLNNGTEKVVLEPVAGAGETLNYILRVENDGSAAASNTRIRDQLPAGVTYVAGSTVNTCGVNSADVNGTSPLLVGAGLNIGTMAIGRRCEVRFRVTIDDEVADGTVLDNFFTVSADGVPPLLIGPASTVVQAAELGQPTKTVAVVGGAEPSAGATLSYTIRIPNRGQRTAPGVSLLDAIPPQLENLQVLSFPAGAQNASTGNTVDIRNITIAAGGFADVVFTARIRDGTPSGTAIANQGSVDQPSLPRPLLTDDPSTAPTPDATVTIVASGVSLVGSSKSVVDVNGGRVEPGDILEFTVRIVKSGSSATVVTLDDDLPLHTSGCTVVSAPPGGFANCGGGGANGTGRVTGAVAFAGAGTGSFVFRVRLDADAPDGFVVENNARLVPLADPVFALTVSSPPLAVFARPELVRSRKAVVDSNGGDARPGDVLEYAITVANTGSVPATNVVVTDVVPANLVDVSPQDGGVLSAGTIRYALPSLAVGASAVLRFTARIAAGTPDGTRIANTATITADAPAQPFTTAPATIIVRASPLLSVRKTVQDLSPAPFRPGDIVRYDIVIENTGDGAASGIVVRDALDPSFESAILNAGGRVEGNDIVFDSATTPALASLAPGARTTVSFDARLLPVLVNGTVVSNQARVRADQVVTPVLSDDPTTAAPGDPTRFIVTSQAVLAMEKTFVDEDGGVLLPGDIVTFRLSVENRGDAPATSVAVVDPLDSRLTFVSSTTGGTFAAGNVSFPTFTLFPGAPQELTFVVRIAAPLANGTIIDNQARATSPVASAAISDDPTTAAPLDPTRLLIVSRPVFDTTTKTVADVDGDGLFEPGDSIRYTIVVTNTGSEDGVNVVVRDALPAVLGSVAVGQGGTLNAGIATWSLGTVPVGASQTLTVDAVLARPLADGLAVDNQAFVQADGVAATPSDDPTTAAIDDPTRFTTFSKPRFIVEKTVLDTNGAPAEPGDALSYTITIRNDGGRDAGAFTVTDAIDPSLTNVVPLDGGVLAANIITWSIGALGLDATVALRFNASLRTPLANGTLVLNQAQVELAEPGIPGAPFLSDDPTTAAPLDKTAIQVVSAADLSATTMETFDQGGAVIDVARPNDVVRYGILVQNRGNAAAVDVVVRLPLPPEVLFVAAPGGALAGGTVSFDRGGVPALAALPPGATVPLAVDVRLRTPLDNGLFISAQARIAAAGVVTPFSSDDPSTAVFGDPTVLAVRSAPDLSSLEKTFVDENGGAVEPGDVVSYRLSVENRGDAIARSTVLVDPLPDEVELMDAGGGVVSGNTVAFDLGALAPGVPVTRTLRVRVRANTAGGTVVANQAAIAAIGVAPTPSDDPTTGAPDDATAFTVLTVPRLRIEKDVVGARIVAPGDVVRYAIVMSSSGTAPVVGAALTDIVSPALTGVVPGPGTSFDPATRTLSAAIPSLAPGASVTLTYSAQVIAGAANGTRIENQAIVRSADLGEVLSDDPTTAPPSDPTIVVVDARPILSTSTKIAVDVDGAPLLPGDVLRWVITVENTGTGTASDVRVSDALASELAIVSIEDGGVTAGNTVVWDQSTTPALASIPRGASVTLSVVTRVSDTVVDGTAISNQASIFTRDLDGPVLTDDPATAPPSDPTIVVVRAPRLSLDKRLVDQDGGDLEPGDLIEYRLELVNAGGVAATDVVVSDVLPLGLVNVSALDGGVIVNGVASWVLPRVEPGRRALLRLRAQVDPLAQGGTVIANRAEVVANEVGLAIRSDDPDTATPDDETIRVVVANEGFAGTVELFDGDSGAPIVGPVVPRQRVRARITFANNGNQVAQAVLLRVPFEPLRFRIDEATAGGLIDGNEVRWDASQNPAFTQMAQGDGAVVELEGAIASPIPDDVAIPVAGLVTTAASASPVTIGPAIMRTKSRPDLSATTKEVFDDDGGLVEPGDVLTYRITVINDGGSVAPGVVVVDPIPGGTIYLAGSTRVRGAPIADVEGRAPTQGGLAVGDIEAGRAVVIEMKVRVAPSAPRGLRIDNQARLRANGVPDAVSDNPATPLILGDPTPVIVGGGASLIAHKVAGTSPAVRGERLRFDIFVENVGTEPSHELVIEDAIPEGTSYVPGSLRIDGAGVTDEVDRDDGELVGNVVTLRRDVLEAGEGVALSFEVVVGEVAIVSNQGAVRSREGTIRTDGDPGVAGAQPTLVPVREARALVIDEGTISITDDDGGVLEPGDAITVRARIQNRSLEPVRIQRLDIALSALLAPEGDSIGDARLVVSPDGRSVRLAAGAELEIEAGGAYDAVFGARVRQSARPGERVRAVASATARSIDGVLTKNVNLGRAELTVGLLPGTGAIEGTLFLDGGEVRSGVFEPETDIVVRGLSVLAFWRDDREPVQTAVADENGRFRLLPIPAGRYRLELRSPGGASFGVAEEGELGTGEVRERNIAVEPTGAVYVSGTARPAERSRVFLFVDDDNRDPADDALVDERILPVGQQGQPVTAQGLYRFDPPPGRYRIGVEPPDPLIAFPSSSQPAKADVAGHPFGAIATPNAEGDVADVPLPRAGSETPYFLRFEVQDGAPRLQRNFVPVDTLKSQLLVTKTASRKRASIGDIVSYVVRIDNRALGGVGTDKGGVEIVDALPPGFKLVDGSYGLERIERDARGQETRRKVAVRDSGGRIRTFGPFELLPTRTYELRYNVIVGPGTAVGEHTNRAALRLAQGQIAISDEALATVQIVPDGIFDLGTVRAKVFCDDDQDGWQDANEPGLPGARLYIDTGQWADADVFGKAHFSAIPAGMHVVKVDERTLPPGTTLKTARQTFYMSAGMPAQIAFHAQCSFAPAGDPELIVNEAAYRPSEPEKKKIRVEGSASPPSLSIDGRQVELPRADLGLASEGDEPTFAGAPGPNLSGVVEATLRPRLVLVPRAEGGAIVAWQIAIEEVEMGAFGLEGSSVAVDEEKGGGRPVWVFAGRGTPPARIAFDGRDPLTATPVLFEGRLYRARLTIAFEGGARSSSPSRVFGVRAGMQPAGAGSGAVHEIDASGGELFTAGGRPTQRLLAWLGERAPSLIGRKIVAVVHTDPSKNPNAAWTAKRAAAVEEALAGFGLKAEDIEPRGAGDAFQKVPNLRKRDRARNRRVELIVEEVSEAAPSLPAPAKKQSRAVVQGKEVAFAEGERFTVEAALAEGESLTVELSSASGAAVSLVRPIDATAASAEALPPIEVEWRPGARQLRVGESEIAASLLELRVGGLLLERGGGDTPGLWSVAAPAGVGEEWTLRIMDDGPVQEGGLGGSAVDEGQDRARVVRELTGQGPPPSQIRWDCFDGDNKPACIEGRRLRARLIVRDARGDVGISPDRAVVVGAGAGGPGAPPPDTPSFRIEDPFDDGDVLSEAARKRAVELARAAASQGATSIRVEVHTDDGGPRLQRRTRTQRAADEIMKVFAEAGVSPAKITALGRGSDEPLAPNVNQRGRQQNRRAEIFVELPRAIDDKGPTTSQATRPALRANGKELAATGGVFSGAAPAMKSGDVVLDVRDESGARASLHVRRSEGEQWQGDPAAYAAWAGTDLPLTADVAAPEATLKTDEPLPPADGGDEQATTVRAGDGAPLSSPKPGWWPDEQKIAARELRVELPPAGEAGVTELHSDRLLVRGQTSPENRVRIGNEEVQVDPLTGRFVHVAKLGEGDGEVVIEAIDPAGNIGRIKRPVSVDSTGWFALVLADTAFGGEGADLGERTPYTSVTLGDTFLYGRGAAFVKGKWRGPWLFQDYDLTLHLDTRRWQDDVFAPELIDPERFFPVYGDSSVENTEAMRSPFPLYLDLKADASRLSVGNVRTDLSGADLFRYQRARGGAQLVFDRGWGTTLETNAPTAGPRPPAPSPVGDPWRTQATAFMVGGGGQRHARAELLGTGSSVYFLRHERVVEGSERVSVIVRDGITGAEIARTPMIRDVDYNVRYLEGRVMFKEPIGAFADAGFIANHNLGQVASGNRVFVEIEYEHQDDDPFMGVGAGAQLKQQVLGHAEVGGGYVYESREGGQLGYQLGGGHLRLYLDEGTWLQGELLGSRSVDAGNFVSFDGGLTYTSLGQSLDQKDGRIGSVRYPADRAGAAFKLEGQAQLGAWLGRKQKSDATLRAYVQELQPGFFAGAAIVEQGQTKWGTEGSVQVVDGGKLKLRYDGVISRVPEIQPLTEFRTLHRQIATVRYEHRLAAPVLVAGEYGYGYTADSGAFGQSAIAAPREFHTNVTALGVDWQLLESVALAVKQEVIVSGDPNQLRDPLDHLVSHVQLKVAVTEQLSLIGGASARWSGENQANAGISWAVNEDSRVYVTERVGVLPAPVTGTMGFRSTTIVGGESKVAEGSTAYAEYQLDGGFAGEQSRGVVGLKNAWKLPYGFALQLGYERILLIGGFVPTTPAGNVPPGAFIDGTFYAAPGANAGGSFVAGEGSRDALSAGLELKRGEAIVASQRFELRYDDQTEARGGRDRLWLLSGSGAAVRLSPELSLLARYNIALAQDLALAQREAYFEEGAFGVAFRPVTHDWVSVLAKISRRVDIRPLSLELGTVDDYTAHALSLDPIVELPWKVQLVEKIAIKHASQKIDDLPEAQAITGLWINRVNLHTLGLLRSLGLVAPIPGEIDLGVEYRVLAGFTYGTVQHGPLAEIQISPVELFRIGVGYNWTRFSDNELDRGDIDRSGFFVRAVGTF